MIQTGLSKKYLPNWSIQEGLREIFQNFEDHGKYELTIEDLGVLSMVRFTSDFKPPNLEFLKIGESGKRDGDKIGQHGEGLKMAMLIFCRECWVFKMYTGDYLVEPTFTNEEYVGEVFAFKVSRCATPHFEIVFTCPTDEIAAYQDKAVGGEDIIYDSGYHGSIVNKEAGNIYCGGLFICNIPGLARAYNFPAGRLRLERDRTIPNGWDLDYHTSQILSGFEETNIGDITGPCSQFVSMVPESVAKSFKAVKVGKEVQLINGEFAATGSVKDALLKHEFVQKKVSKIRYKMCRKKKPVNILQDFFDKVEGNLTGDQKADFRSILLKAKDWCFN